MKPHTTSQIPNLGLFYSPETRGAALASRPIGVFDSGVGGISTLQELTSVMPTENFIYYGDSLHAPYGEKSPAEILTLATQAIEHLLAQQVKLVVIACNTATSVAIEDLRLKYPTLDIVGLEPAIKSAARTGQTSLVMATPVTLSLAKYQTLKQELSKSHRFIDLPCPGLAQRIEHGNLTDNDLHQMLTTLLQPYISHIDNVVLGCTHYPFIKTQIQEIFGPNIPLIDGNHGAAINAQKILATKNLLNPQTTKPQIIFQSSKNAPEELALYQKFFQTSTPNMLK